MRLFRLIGPVVWAIPVYFLWNYLAPIYLSQLPAQYLDIPFWHIAGAFVLWKIVLMMIFPHHFHRPFYKYGKFSKFKKFQRFAHHHHGGCGTTETYYHR